MDKSSDLVRGTLDLLILKVLSLECPSTVGPSRSASSKYHATNCKCSKGRCIRRCTGSRSKRVDRGALLTSETGRDAKFYALTPAGRKRLEEELATWARLSGAINLVVRTT